MYVKQLSENELLNKILGLFKLNILEVNINKIGNSTNIVYELKNENNEYILRISKQYSNNLSQYEAEMDYVNYLFHMKANVSKIIPSINNKLVEVIHDDECHFVSVFEKAKGYLPAVDNIDEWNESLFYKWGKTMGKIHCLTKDYKTKEGVPTRRQWNEDIYFGEEYDFSEEYAGINKIWSEIIKEINTFTKGRDSYGLIHNDFHQYNFFVYNGDITVFDFDDCLYQWYVCDIAIAIYHSLQTIPVNSLKERREFATKFIESFLNGYLEENKLEKEWIERIPIFLEYRRICSYKFILKLWRKNELNNFKEEYLKNMRYDIENRMPYINIDFKKLKKLNQELHYNE